MATTGHLRSSEVFAARLPARGYWLVMEAQTHEWFTLATDAVLEVVAGITPHEWGQPALGVWTVRELTAHTIRAWTTITDYLDAPPPSADLEVVDAATYLAVGLTTPGIHDGVASRSRAEAVELTDPVSTARGAASAAQDALAANPDDKVIMTRIAPMTLGEYLRTRALELSVHGLDLAHARTITPSTALDRCAVPALALCAEVAGQRRLATPLLRAVSGRGRLDDAFTLFA